MSEDKKDVAELLGTFVLVLIGCGSAVLAGSYIGFALSRKSNTQHLTKTRQPRNASTRVDAEKKAHELLHYLEQINHPSHHRPQKRRVRDDPHTAPQDTQPQGLKR